jgi:hypothetical protein
VECNDPLKEENFCSETSEGAANAYATLHQAVFNK